jgi:Protein of unknown function (DUF982)
VRYELARLLDCGLASLPAPAGRLAKYREEIMMRQSFNRPVGVLVGLGLPVEVGTVMEAYRLLDDWPPSQRNAAHLVAIKACKAALLDLIDAETARAAFAAFARKNDNLVELETRSRLTRTQRTGLPGL